MKIQMISLMAGPQGVRQAGKEYEVEEGEARELIAGHFAVEVKKRPAAPAREDAPPETAAMSVEGIEKSGKRGGKVRHAEKPAAPEAEAPAEESEDAED